MVLRVPHRGFTSLEAGDLPPGWPRGRRTQPGPTAGRSRDKRRTPYPEPQQGISRKWPPIARDTPRLTVPSTGLTLWISDPDADQDGPARARQLRSIRFQGLPYRPTLHARRPISKFPLYHQLADRGTGLGDLASHGWDGPVEFQQMTISPRAYFRQAQIIVR